MPGCSKYIHTVAVQSSLGVSKWQVQFYIWSINRPKQRPQQQLTVGHVTNVLGETCACVSSADSRSWKPVGTASTRTPYCPCVTQDGPSDWLLPRIPCHSTDTYSGRSRGVVRRVVASRRPSWMSSYISGRNMSFSLSQADGKAAVPATQQARLQTSSSWSPAVVNKTGKMACFVNLVSSCSLHMQCFWLHLRFCWKCALTSLTNPTPSLTNVVPRSFITSYDTLCYSLLWFTRVIRVYREIFKVTALYFELIVMHGHTLWKSRHKYIVRMVFLPINITPIKVHNIFQ